MKNYRAYIVKIKIKSDSWHYKKGDTLLSTILSTHSPIYIYKKLISKIWQGSEYPDFEITAIKEIENDKSLFIAQII
jgi:hypothetical protein